MEYLSLQQQIRQDPDGYRVDFLQLLRHYEASVKIFKTRPNEPSKEFSALVRFIASVSDSYPKATCNFVADLLDLLAQHYEVMDKSLRKALVQSLMQLRQRKRLEWMPMLSLFFRLFASKDKALRRMLFAFIVSDVKASNARHNGQHPLNRQMKGFLLNTLKDKNEMIAKKALAILTDLWRRQIWHDVHTANVIAAALEHPNNTVMYATVKFFLGYDLKECEDDDDSDHEQEQLQKEAQLCNEDVYRAQKKGTRTSKKKKQKKLKRVKAALLRQARKSHEQVTEQFAAIQLLQDPYKIAETLFTRIRGGKVTVQTRLATIRLLSRIISVHRLVLLNYYPYLQKYLIPRGKDMTTILAALVEGCHEMVPPDVLEPVLRYVVNNFIHDHARPEIITVGLKTVREMCSRAPLIMTAELLSDLVLYSKFKDAEVRASAKGLVSLFREIAPSLLPNKDRDRRTEVTLNEPLPFGREHVYTRIEGAELLQKQKQALRIESADEVMSNSEVLSLSEMDDSDSDDDESSPPPNVSPGQTRQTTADPQSLTSLRKQLIQLQQKQKPTQLIQHMASDSPSVASETLSVDDTQTSEEKSDDDKLEELSDGDVISDEKEKSETAVLPIEMTEILDDEDFQRLQELKREEAVRIQMKKYGLQPGSERSHRLTEAAEADADEWLKKTKNRTHITESGLDPNELLAKKRGKANKTERMLSVLKGREDDSSFQSKTATRKQKTGGLSNREKIKRKSLPLKGRLAQAKKRRKINATKRKGKRFRGHVKNN